MLIQEWVDEVHAAGVKEGKKIGYDKGLVEGANSAWPGGVQRFGSIKDQWQQAGYDEGYRDGFREGGNGC